LTVTRDGFTHRDTGDKGDSVLHVKVRNSLPHLRAERVGKRQRNRLDRRRRNVKLGVGRCYFCSEKTRTDQTPPRIQSVSQMQYVIDQSQYVQAIDLRRAGKELGTHAGRDDQPVQWQRCAVRRADRSGIHIEVRRAPRKRRSIPTASMRSLAHRVN